MARAEELKARAEQLAQGYFDAAEEIHLRGGSSSSVRRARQLARGMQLRALSCTDAPDKWLDATAEVLDHYEERLASLREALDLEPPTPRPSDADVTPPDGVHGPGMRRMTRTLAEELELRALRFERHPLDQDLAKAKQCRALAAQLKHLARHTSSWPGLSPAALEGAKGWSRAQWRKLMAEAKSLLDDEFG
jgi:hypothetical protein